MCCACGRGFALRFDQCSKCGSWGSCEALQGRASKATTPDDRFLLLSSARAHSPARLLISPEWNKAFGGDATPGLAEGSTNILWGKPGAGKTTELLRILSIAGGLHIFTEDLDPQAGMLRLTADNAGIDCSQISVTTAATPAEAIKAMRSRTWPIIAVDSLQGFDHDGAGGPRMLKRTARDAVDAAQSIGATLLMVVHSTRDGDMSGPQWLAHLVDGIFCLSSIQIRVVKNRFGPMPIKVKRTKPRLRLVG